MSASLPIRQEDMSDHCSSESGRVPPQSAASTSLLPHGFLGPACERLDRRDVSSEVLLLITPARVRYRVMPPFLLKIT